MEILASPAEAAATANQLAAINRDLPDVVVAGGMARAATHALAPEGYEVPPFDVHSLTEPNGLRDLDLVFSEPEDTVWYGSSPEMPHAIDRTLGYFVRRNEDDSSVALHGIERGRAFFIPLHPDVVQPVERTLLGAPVRTFSVGTQLHMGNLTRGTHNSYQKAVRNSGAFALFADAVRDVHPQEFLSDEYYEPFAEFRRRCGEQ